MIARRVPLALALALLAGCGGDGKCGGGVQSKLSVWAEKERLIGAAFRLTGAEPGALWRVVVVHEGHITWRGKARVGEDGTLNVKRQMDDYPGADRVAVRAYGPGGATCTKALQLTSPPET